MTTGFRSVGVPCALWAGTTGLLTLFITFELDLGPFWSAVLIVVAAILAGFGAWLTYDLPGLWAAMKYSASRTIAWRPEREKLKLAAVGALAGISVWSTLALWSFLLQTSAEAEAEHGTRFAVLALLILFHAFLSYAYDEKDSKWRGYMLGLAKWGNPIGLLVCLVHILLWCARHVPTVFLMLGFVLRATGGFCRLTYIKVNCSERRARALGTFTGIVLGCAIGYPLGSALGGALACGAIGFFAGMRSYHYAREHRGDVLGYLMSRAV